MIFRTLTSNWIRRGFFRYPGRLMTPIGNYIDIHNVNPNPTSGRYRHSTSLKRSLAP
jgi:hypothetical protein